VTDLAGFPDLETAIRTALADLVTDLAHTGTVTPADLQQRLPFIRVRRFGGTDDRLTDQARVDVDYFAASRAAAWAGAEAVRQRLISRPLRVGAVVIDQVTTTTAPIEVPWDDPNVRRVTAAYTASARR
jgi:hypothetical protein